MAKLPDDVLAHFVDREEFCHPEWPAISQKIEAGIPEEQKTEIWREAVLTWLDRVQKKLGPTYTIFETRHFFLVANPTGKPVRDYFAFVERTRQLLHEVLQNAAWKGGYGKHVVLLFDEQKDYYQYLAPFYGDGDHPASGGVFLRGGGYRHIAIPFDRESFLTTFAHEYTHNCLCHLAIPRWLNEALAMRFERMMVSSNALIVDHEVLEKHEKQWNADTIQEFWKGESWSKADESFNLSYQLSRILLGKIEEVIRPPKERLRSFILEAHYRDAGEVSSLKHLQVGLGDLVTDFLGNGEWTPNPDQWKASK